MNRGILICIVSVLGVLGGGLLALSSYQKHCFTTPTQTYATLEEAVKEGVVARKWLPDFLPPSATRIYEKRNYEQNTVIARFSFDPSDNVAPILLRGQELPPAALASIRPSPIGKKESWFPDAITSGRFEELRSSGFRFYAVREESRVGETKVTNTWYLALNQKAGTCFLWFAVEPAGPSLPAGIVLDHKHMSQ